jgi:gliding motility-associated-like protein
LLDAFSPYATEYTWQNGSTAQTFNVTAPSTYGVTVKNDFCIFRDSIRVDFDNLPVFSLGPDTLLCRGVEYPIQIAGLSNYVYTWQDQSTQSSFTVREQGTYYLAVENQCGVRSDTVTVRYGSCNCDFYFPTGFTPNDDGLNDTFYPFVDCDSLQSYRLEIFNRWGESLFATERPDEAWRAAEALREFRMEVYVWIIEYKWTWLGQVMSRRDKGIFSIIK